MRRLSKEKLWIILAVVVLLGLLLPGPATAQGSDPTDDDVNAVAKQLYCPVCENIPLDACGTAACEQWRGIIRDKLKEGWSEDQIKTYFVNQYGDRVLAEPPRRGFNWLIYIVPGLIFVAGGFLLYRGFNQWRKAEPETRTGVKVEKRPVKNDHPDLYLNKVEEELKKRAGKSK
ncbi:MAG: hypothetical protein E4H33_01485 [Anaerolineales bacterium]|nr:MAG: hypothetical protein E4H33_01485 [Anaerolineales bacterium]